MCRDSVDLATYFGSCWSVFDHVIQGSQPTGNGDDATVLFLNNTAVDTHGVVGVDGTGEPWEYLDSWAWRDTAASNVGNWVYGGVNCSDGSSSMQTSSCPYPLCSPPPPAGSTCDVTFNMYDSFGDGWNGSTVDITVNGATVVTGATIASGSFDSVVVTANIGDAVALAN